MPWYSRASPGQAIYTVLSEKGQASISELHRYYKGMVKGQELEKKQKGEKTHGVMTYESFRTYVTKAQKLGLIEKVAEKPVQRGDWGNGMPLVGISGSKVVSARQVLYSLTAKGQSADPDTWSHLQSYYNQSL